MYKKWLKYFFLFCVLIVIVLEINYQYNRKHFTRHELDYKVQHLLPDSASRNIDTIFFSTSVTYGPIREYKIKDNILDLCTVHSVGILGQYFMLKRYLKHNTVDHVYLFSLPKSFDENLSQVNHMYIESVFDDEEEKEFLSSIREEEYKTDYFYTRIHYLKFWKSTYQTFDKKILSVDEEMISLNPYHTQVLVRDEAKEMKKINTKVDIVFKKFVELCRNNNIDLTVVIEPLPDKIYKNYMHSGLDKYILSHHIKLVDFNTLHTFKDSAFHDEIHLNKIEQKNYMYIVDKHILDFLEK